MEIKVGKLLFDQIEDGIKWGIRRHYKHQSVIASDAEVAAMTDTIASEISIAVCNYFDFSDEVPE